VVSSIDSIVGLAEVPQALVDLEGGLVSGKIAIAVA
jgi:hypothetical protein